MKFSFNTCIHTLSIEIDGTYGGVAPSGKVAFMDLSSGGNGIAVPGADVLFGAGYSAAARVFSFSWGSVYNGPGYYAGAGYDTYLFNHMVHTYIVNFWIMLNQYCAVGNNGVLRRGKQR